jgi:hypothetical protein
MVIYWLGSCIIGVSVSYHGNACNFNYFSICCPNLDLIRVVDDDNTNKKKKRKKIYIPSLKP